MRGRLAIIAGDGALPVEIARARPEALMITLEGIASRLQARAQRHRLERIGALFAALRAAEVESVVFAGALTRPALDPAAFDPEMKALAPRLLPALRQGDDTLLKVVIEVFEDQGFSVIGADQVLPALVAEPGLALGPAPGAEDEADIARATTILRATSALDIGQGCVVAGGQCLGLETVQGTDALLHLIAGTAPEYRRGGRGVFVKMAKLGQDLRIDMPAIGPRTVTAVHAAGLAGLAVEARRVMILEREATFEAVKKSGIFLVTIGP